MLKRLSLMVLLAGMLSACAATAPSAPSSFYHCDRNGEREQRAEC